MLSRAWLKLLVLVLPLLLAGKQASSQEVQSFVVNSAGGYFPGSHAKISYSVGETAIQILKSNDLTLKQGFLYLPLLTITGVDDDLNPWGIYPNPASRTLTIDVPWEGVPFEVEVTDVCGRHYISSTEKTIDVHSLDAGLYLLRVEGQDKKHVKVLKFIKR
jgi:hypothetical protein